MIGRVGLLSWVVSFVVSDDVSIVLPTTDSRRACLELILAIVQATSSQSDIYVEYLVVVGHFNTPRIASSNYIVSISL